MPSKTSRARPDELAEHGGEEWTDDMKFRVIHYFGQAYTFHQIAKQLGKTPMGCRILKYRLLRQGSPLQKRMMEEAVTRRERVLLLKRQARGRQKNPAAEKEQDVVVDEGDDLPEEEQDVVADGKSMVEGDGSGSEESSPMSTNGSPAIRSIQSNNPLGRNLSHREWVAIEGLVSLRLGRNLSDEEINAHGLQSLLPVQGVSRMP